MDTLSDYMRNGTEVWANCETPQWAHGAALDLQPLIDPPGVGDVTIMTLRDLGLLRCNRCGSRDIHLNIQPPLRPVEREYLTSPSRLN